jgi:hypothetical protein
MDEYPVQIGSMLFTMVDPNEGHEVAYNRWYERDHFYAGCMIGPWLFAGGRWVAPRPLKDLRFPEKSPFAEPVDAGSYLSIYWMHKDHVDEHLKWAGEQVVWLYANGRGFQERTHAHTSIYDLVSVKYADEDGVPLELALDHHFPGLGVLVTEPAEGVSQADHQAWLEAEAVPDLLAADGVSTWTAWVKHPVPEAQPARQSPMALGTDGGSVDRLVQLVFIEGDPAGAWDAFRAFGAKVDSGDVAKLTFAAPFFGTNVGTDDYADQLW